MRARTIKEGVKEVVSIGFQSVTYILFDQLSFKDTMVSINSIYPTVQSPQYITYLSDSAGIYLVAVASMSNQFTYLLCVYICHKASIWSSEDNFWE